MGKESQIPHGNASTRRKKGRKWISRREILISMPNEFRNYKIRSMSGQYFKRERRNLILYGTGKIDKGELIKFMKVMHLISNCKFQNDGTLFDL
jgi:hypothetical protein